MKNPKTALCVVAVLTFLSACEHESEMLSPEMPDWLAQLIENIEGDDYYAGAVIYRHEWRGQYYYHLMIPLSSCAYCDVYDQNGKKIEWTGKQQEFEDYLNNRKNEKVVWRWNH